ncbi:MAG: hypothetical protein OIN87_00695 [Candidatus Methanoperedens sp.]|nr:hypothetical protein [Candidatus Methanoperedens sp.]
MDKASLLFYKKIPINDFKEAFSETLYVAGGSVDDRILDFITQIDLHRIRKLIILTPYSNLDKKFIISWSGLAKYVNDMRIELIMKAPEEKIPSDIFFLDKNSSFFIPRFYFEKEISECCVSRNIKLINQIRDAFASAEDFTHLKGNEIYHKKFNNLFQIDQRHLSDKEKDMVLEAIYSWETSGYGDIEPLWRILETKVRNFIKIRLEQENSSDWFSTRVLPCFDGEIQAVIISHFEKSKGRLGIDTIDEHPNPNEFLVAENYENIINNRTNKHLFHDFRDGTNKKFVEYFRDSIKARNPSIHNRTPDEDTDLYSNIIVKILMTLEWLNRLEAKLLSDDLH